VPSDFESSDSLGSFLHREPRLDPSLLSIGIMCDIRVAHGRQFTGGVFAGVSMIVRAVGDDLNVLVGQQLRREFLNSVWGNIQRSG
jgi:hypothetical protein